MEMSTREAALCALERSRRDGAWSDAVLDSIIRRAGLDKRDAALTSRLCYGVQQNQSLCDFYINAYSSTRTARMEPKVLDILRLSVYAIMFLDRIPIRATIFEAVELCKKNGVSRASGLVNAVLRRIAENRDSLPEIPGKGTAEYLSTLYSHPLWLVKSFVDRLGYDACEALLKANNDTPGIWAQVNTLKTDMDTLMKDGAEMHPWLPECILLPDGADGMRVVYEGLAYVQDPAARIAVLAAAPKPGMSVLDACAAPGGKSFASAMLMKDKGSILSCDLHDKKLGRLRTQAQRLGVGCIETRAMDARKAASLGMVFDLVLADVPCSGLGVIRKKPDIRYKDEKELAGLPEIQLDILRGVSKCVKPGGVLLYSTCTLMEAENEAVCTQFLRENQGFSTDSFELPGPIGKVESGMLTMWPHIHDTDGFFVCKMRRSI